MSCSWHGLHMIGRAFTLGHRLTLHANCAVLLVATSPSSLCLHPLVCLCWVVPGKSLKPAISNALQN